jgi:hypothetical protein
MPSQLLTGAAKSGAETVVNRECRVYERHSCELPSKCQPASSIGKENLKWPARLENISQGGVCLNLRRRFEPGTGLTIELPSTDGQDAYAVLAKVVHVRRQENGFWFLGCKFISELSDDEMQRLLRCPSRAAPPSSDYDLNLPFSQCDITPPPGPPVVAKTPAAKPAAKPNRSADKRRIGHVQLKLEIALRTTVDCLIDNFASTHFWPLAANTVGVLKGKDKQGQPWKLRVKVQRCQSTKEGWQLECGLIKMPSEPELLRALGGLILKI